MDITDAVRQLYHSLPGGTNNFSIQGVLGFPGHISVEYDRNRPGLVAKIPTEFAGFRVSESPGSINGTGRGQNLNITA